MALLIEKNMTILGDLNILQTYVRLTVNYGPDGNLILVQADPYTSKVAYEENAHLNKFYMPRLTGSYDFIYDRVTNGSDLLTFAHEEMKAFLSTDIMGEVPVLDPSTGEPTYDPSTGLPIMEEVVTIPKFAEDSSIFIVDVSIL